MFMVKHSHYVLMLHFISKAFYYVFSLENYEMSIGLHSVGPKKLLGWNNVGFMLGNKYCFTFKYYAISKKPLNITIMIIISCLNFKDISFGF